MIREIDPLYFIGSVQLCFQKISATTSVHSIGAVASVITIVAIISFSILAIRPLLLVVLT